MTCLARLWLALNAGLDERPSGTSELVSGKARDCGRDDLDGDQCDVCFQHDGMNSLS